MPTTEKQCSERVKWIGASDVPGIFGIDPFKSPLDIYNSKVNPEPWEPSEVGSAIWYGHMLEDAVLAMTWEKLGLPRGDEMRFDGQQEFEHECGFIKCHVDSIFPGYYYRKKWVEGPVAVEVKTQGFKGTPPNDDWGRAGTDKVTDKVMLQVQTQLMCSSLEVAIVPRFTGHKGSGLQIYIVKSHKKLQTAILDRCSHFWNTHVLRKVPPQ